MLRDNKRIFSSTQGKEGFQMRLKALLALKQEVNKFDDVKIKKFCLTKEII